MQDLEEQIVACPYCGELISVLLDPSEAGDEYTEDCQVCCRPIVFQLLEDPSGLSAMLRREDE